MIVAILVVVVVVLVVVMEVVGEWANRDVDIR